MRRQEAASGTTAGSCVNRRITGSAKMMKKRPMRPRKIMLYRPVRQTEVSARSEEHTSELQSQSNLVCRLLLEKKKKKTKKHKTMKKSARNITIQNNSTH